MRRRFRSGRAEMGEFQISRARALHAHHGADRRYDPSAVCSCRLGPVSTPGKAYAWDHALYARTYRGSFEGTGHYQERGTVANIIIETGSPYFTETENLESLASSLRSRSEDTDVIIAPPSEQRGYAGTLWEVVHVWIPWEELSLVAAGWVLDEAKDWLKARVQKSRAEKEKLQEENPNLWHIVRPTAVNIYNINGDILTTIEQQASDEEPREIAPDKYTRKRQPPEME
jgi:hypothetical protein